VIRCDHGPEDRPRATDGCSFQVLDQAVVVYVENDSLTLNAARINVISRIGILNPRTSCDNGIDADRLSARNRTT
jgi:hypothetical protein